MAKCCRPVQPPQNYTCARHRFQCSTPREQSCPESELSILKRYLEKDTKRLEEMTCVITSLLQETKKPLEAVAETVVPAIDTKLKSLVEYSLGSLHTNSGTRFAHQNMDAKLPLHDHIQNRTVLLATHSNSFFLENIDLLAKEPARLCCDLPVVLPKAGDVVLPSLHGTDLLIRIERGVIVGIQAEGIFYAVRRRCHASNGILILLE